MRSIVSSGMRHAVVESPYGPLTLVATGGVLSGLYMTGQRHRPAEESFGERVAATEEPFPEVVRQLTAYFAGELTEFDLPPPAGRHRVPAQCLGAARTDPVRRDVVVR